MTSFIITTNSTTQQVLGQAEQGTVAEGAGIYTGFMTSIGMNHYSYLYVMGQVVSQIAGVWASTAYSPIEIYVGRNGSIVGAYRSILATAPTVVIQNDGTLAGTDAIAIQLGGFGGGGQYNIVNTGIITGAQIAIHAAVADGGFLRLQSSGTIISGGLYGVYVDGETTAPPASAQVFINNSGTIQADVAIHAGLYRANVVNAGEIIGNIELGAYSSVYDGRHGITTGTVYGYGGSDRILGGDSVDIFDGGNGNDLLRGYAGEDELSGGSGNDTLRGGEGDDTLNGGAGIDTLFGNTGDDFIFGQSENDTIFGRLGDDSINGGGGADRLIGGAGEDVFVYTAIGDSTNTAFDTITDFRHGTDDIDLAAVVPGAFVFSGTGAFAGGGHASVRYAYTASNNTLVYLDTDGNGTVDGRIALLGRIALTADDFVL